MVGNDSDQWSGFCGDLKRLRAKLSSIAVKQVSSDEFRYQAKALVQLYFSGTRPELVNLGVDVATLDGLMHTLLEYANKRVLRKSYQELLKAVEQVRRGVDLDRVTRLGSPAAIGRDTVKIVQGIEAQIIDTLERFRPSSALSYKQVLLDLQDSNRISFRGTAAEMREVFREVLDSLAPDIDVMGRPGFKLEEKCSGPTMRQKVVFVLDSRGGPKSAQKTAVDAATVVENTIGTFARATYERASLSTHISCSREDLLQLKMYVDAVLGELLEIHTRGNPNSAPRRT
jgi:hypothetical protein